MYHCDFVNTVYGKDERMMEKNMMKERIIRLNETSEVREFVSAAEKCDFDINLIYRHVFIDAKSFLGVMGLLMNDMKVSYGGENQMFEHVVKKYAVA